MNKDTDATTAIYEHVLKMRQKDGFTLEEIAFALDVSRQRAHEVLHDALRWADDTYWYMVYECAETHDKRAVPMAEAEIHHRHSKGDQRTEITFPCSACDGKHTITIRTTGRVRD